MFAWHCFVRNWGALILIATIATPADAAESEKRRWKRFHINKPALLISVNKGLHGVASRKCQVLDISIGGAAIQVITTIGLPDHYYLSFLGSDIRIGAAEVHRNGTRIGLEFIKPLDELTLERLLKP